MIKIKKEDIIGRVLEADIQKNNIRAHLYVHPETVNIGMPLIIDGDSAKYYCIVVNLIERQDEMTQEMSFNNVGLKDGIDLTISNLEEPNAMQIYIDLTCLKILYNNGKRIPFKTIPPRLSIVRKATQEDINQIYAEKLVNELKNKITFEETSESFNKDLEIANNFSFGSLASTSHVEIPVRFDRMVERPMGIFGMTGSGKTVTTKDLCCKIIGDKNKILNTRMIIFDVQNEYVTRTANRFDPGLYDLFPEKIKIITLDPRKAESQGIHNAEVFRIFKENVNLDDIIGILSNTNLTEKMVSTLIAVNRRWEIDQRNVEIKRTFYDYLMDFYNDEKFASQFDSTGSSYEALHRRLRYISPDEGYLSKFLTDPTSCNDIDTIKDITNQLKSMNSSKKSFIIHFGKYGKKSFVYEFVANILLRNLYNTYTDENDILSEDDTPPYDRCVVLLEEGHKFVRKRSEDSSGRENVCNLLARETRKYGLSLWVVDQMPSKIDEEIVAQFNNRIIHRLTDEQDIKVGLAGLDKTKWGGIVSNLEDGECLCFGQMVENMGTVIKSFFSKDYADWENYHGADKIISIIKRDSDEAKTTEKKERLSSVNKEVIINKEINKKSVPKKESIPIIKEEIPKVVSKDAPIRKRSPSKDHPQEKNLSELIKNIQLDDFAKPPDIPEDNDEDSEDE